VLNVVINENGRISNVNIDIGGEGRYRKSKKSSLARLIATINGGGVSEKIMAMKIMKREAKSNNGNNENGVMKERKAA